MKNGKKYMKSLNNYAFIDGNNLYLGAKSQNLCLDYRKFRKYLRGKFGVNKAYLFIGYTHENTGLYSRLQEAGFILVFKPTIPFVDDSGKKTMKGNVDAELVLQAAAIDFNNYNKAVIISSDGDFACLMRFLDEKNKLVKIITPTVKYSKLLKPFHSYILPLGLIKNQVS